ncbi:hypothetical protein [Pseudomonas sp. MF6747]|uniref:hypothetical protein n=1 Tax=Pseudomonas sp. MF6747 TaxID=2797527 RepID=UPI00190CF4B3|nr:hypothetical protein [Pseudomonas sp. MF6747]MBK3511408.1 hypothetical protein [Pseudomonas sp. MF6747]
MLFVNLLQAIWLPEKGIVIIDAIDYCFMLSFRENGKIYIEAFKLFNEFFIKIVYLFQTFWSALLPFFGLHRKDNAALFSWQTRRLYERHFYRRVQCGSQFYVMSGLAHRWAA